jgi:hypothetical protein
LAPSIDLPEQIVLIKDGKTENRDNFVFSSSCVAEEDFPKLVHIKDGGFVVDTCALYYRDNAILTDYPHIPEGFDMDIVGSTRHAQSTLAGRLVCYRLNIHYVYFRKRATHR